MAPGTFLYLLVLFALLGSATAIVWNERKLQHDAIDFMLRAMQDLGPEVSMRQIFILTSSNSSTGSRLVRIGGRAALRHFSQELLEEIHMCSGGIL